ncbi:LutC/YkgG family protein [Deinococcus roseus]|uniref:Lactate utilization protein C n=1 Tax=Deinococcus roseus TaxID=392414 RepID=A0ABQ2DFN0_9DEIO|nr:lactate utilization protein C [Deinococcus roseus]GGJ56021.1 lactate utilization protein C [Deinococcus roseus]
MKEQILKAVRAKKRAAVTPLPAYPERPRRTDEEVLARFLEHVEDYKARVERTQDLALLPALIQRFLQGQTRVVIPADLPVEWLPEGLTLIRDTPDLSLNTLKQQEVVITGCKLGISDTGTIVLDSAVRQGRRIISLIPDHHICIVFRDQVVQGVFEATTTLEPSVQAGLPLTWISGPSATSDIELVRVEGVHGPRTLDVLVVG